MKKTADKAPDNKSKAVAHASSSKKSDVSSPAPFIDNRPEAIAQRKLQGMANAAQQNIPVRNVVQKKQDSIFENQAVSNEQPIQGIFGFSIGGAVAWAATLTAGQVVAGLVLTAAAITAIYAVAQQCTARNLSPEETEAQLQNAIRNQEASEARQAPRRGKAKGKKQPAVEAPVVAAPVRLPSAVSGSLRNDLGVRRKAFKKNTPNYIAATDLITRAENCSVALAAGAIETEIGAFLARTEPPKRTKKKKPARAAAAAEPEAEAPAAPAFTTHYFGDVEFRKTIGVSAREAITTDGGAAPMMVIPCTIDVGGAWVASEIHGHVDKNKTTGKKAQRKYTHFSQIHFKTGGAYSNVKSDTPFTDLADINTLCESGAGMWRFCNNWTARINQNDAEFRGRQQGRAAAAI